ncbi:MAG: AI-2E family transporter [Sulfurimonas sp.]|nr:AI-2E family transporter [Sulfurimonas sp.]
MLKINEKSTISLIAYILIIIASLKLGGGFILPFLMAFFIFIIFLPLINKLNSFSIPNVISSLIVFSIIVVIIFLLISFIVSSSNDIVKNIPLYQEKFHQLTPQIIAFFEQFKISLKWSHIINLIEPAKVINQITIFFKGMGNIILNLFLTLFLVIFLLLESSMISKKAFYLAKTKQQKEKLKLFLKSINRYFILKTFTSALTALFIWIMLKYFNLQYAFIFAVLAFLLNFIPSIGSYIASFPPLFISILQLNILDTIIIAIGYLIINNLIGSFLEPKIMGKDLGLSTFIVFVSMVIWGWILGPLGMLLAVPLTIAIKIASQNSEKYHWLSVVLSDNIKGKI